MMTNKFRQLHEKFNNRFSKPVRIVVYSAVVLLLALCVTGVGIAAKFPDASATVRKTSAETNNGKNISATPSSISNNKLETAKKEVSEAQNAFNKSKNAYNKDSKSQSTKEEIVKNGELLLNAKRKLLNLTTDNNDREKIQEDISTISSEVEKYKEVAVATPKVEKKKPEPTPEIKKKESQNSGKTSENAKGKGNGYGTSKKGCKTVNHPAKTHIVHHPAVTHEEPVYTSQQVQTGTRTVVDQQAYDESIPDGERAVCGACGQKFLTTREIEDHLIEAHDGVGNYWVERAYKTIHHDAVTHEEPVYTTQQVQTGTKTVTDQAAWDETVVDQPAYTTCE